MYAIAEHFRQLGANFSSVPSLAAVWSFPVTKLVTEWMKASAHLAVDRTSLWSPLFDTLRESFDGMPWSTCPACTATGKPAQPIDRADQV